MKKVTLLMIAMLSLCLAGCNNKDPEINAFISELDAVTKEIVAKIDADPSAAGLDAAQKALDGRKASIKTKWDSVIGTVDFSVKLDAKKKLDDSVASNVTSISDVIKKHMANFETDEETINNLKILITD